MSKIEQTALCLLRYSSFFLGSKALTARSLP
jgi:hypothetical protein